MAAVGPLAARIDRSAADPDALRSVLGRFASGVTFVTAAVGDTPLGLVVSAFTAVSVEPPLVAFCPSRASLTWRRMRTAGRFAVNVLAEHHAEFVRHATPPGADRFARADHALSDGGVPVIRDALAVVECDLEDEHAAGDHWIVVGRVTDLANGGDGRPLIYWSRALGRWEPARGLAGSRRPS